MPNKITYNDKNQIVSVDIEFDSKHATAINNQIKIANDAKEDFIKLLKDYGVTLTTFPMTLDQAEKFAKKVHEKKKDKKKAFEVADNLSLIGYRFQSAGITISDEAKKYLSSGNAGIDALAKEAAVNINSRMSALNAEIDGHKAEIAEIQKKIAALEEKISKEKDNFAKFKNILISHAKECDEFKRAKSFVDDAKEQIFSNFKTRDRDILWEKSVESFMKKEGLSLTGR